MKIHISTGASRLETKWKLREMEWADLAKRLHEATRTPETMAQYAAMPKADRGRIKDVGGFVGGRLIGGRRSALSVVDRSLVTLDIDFAKPDTIARIDAQLDCAYVIYSTHSYTPERPRYRLVMPLSRAVTPTEYGAIARRVAETLGIDEFDDSTYEPSRLMYWPSVPADGEYICEEGIIETPLDADEVLATYVDPANPAEWPVSSRITRALAPSSRKQQDPREKGGIIGAFCRAYTISEALDTFLPGEYEQTATPGRYTYTKGSTTGGMVVYDDTFAYSHHGTDPSGGQLVNAFDLVRLHRFADLDAETAPGTPVNRLPSFKAMSDFAGEDAKTLVILDEERRQLADTAFGNIEDPEAESWIKSLKRDSKHNIKSTPDNIETILENDPNLKGRSRYNEFSGQIIIEKDLPWRSLDETSEENTPKPANWDDTDNAGLQIYLSRIYGVQAKATTIDVKDYVIKRKHAFHPVKSYLRGLVWDGKPRLDTILIDYLGAEDNALTRAMTRKHLVAAVKRIMEPGCKYDFVLTLVGPEGIGKSQLIARLGRSQWASNTIYTIEGKDGAEGLRGTWLAEMGELTNYKGSTTELYKNYLSTTHDRFRPAYGREIVTFPRQCVFFATTNERTFLKGATGNRRFWVVDVGVTSQTCHISRLTADVVDQIWAEAIWRYDETDEPENLYLSGTYFDAAKERQETHNEADDDERVGMIREFLLKRRPRAYEDWSVQDRIRYNKTPDYMPVPPGDPIDYHIDRICVLQIMQECFGIPLERCGRFDKKPYAQLLNRMPELVNVGPQRCRPYGLQRSWQIDRAKLLAELGMDMPE